MDRLICGDVGFGKTEVAVRAAFKAAQEGKQVAILVPTTILAQQHHDTFRRRLGSYPLQVALLSRFQSNARQKEVVADLESGAVDIVIGTHRLLSRDIKFADLGLVVVDEEQRFGVAQKERLKKLRAEVDVLTLTATPIPRTLHMALTEVRDISVIESPPHDRRPVKSYVTAYEEGVVREAIESELARGGQVFFVHNRVNSIYGAAAKISRICPRARVAVAHGQMPSSALESVMVEFAGGQHDVLVCTAIIENGVDLPNVNTLVVDECWMFGLAQLYQLRGRVGRSATQAYAYFLYSREDRLTEAAQKRLQAVLEANDLGAGLRLAMRDLQIRGAGDMLGANQSGFANSVGLYMYLQMVRDAVREAKGSDPGEHRQRRTLTPVDLPLSAYIPDEYAGTYAAKLREYQRLVRADSVSDVEAVAAGLRDRFGEFPDPVANLIYVAKVRAHASELGIDSIATTGADLVMRMDPEKFVDRGDLRRRLGPEARLGQLGITWPDFEDFPDWRQRLLSYFERSGARRVSRTARAAPG
jgi:transcription-repair coupling factor (superfamily II helicase)